MIRAIFVLGIAVLAGTAEARSLDASSYLGNYVPAHACKMGNFPIGSLAISSTNPTQGLVVNLFSINQTKSGYGSTPVYGVGMNANGRFWTNNSYWTTETIRQSDDGKILMSSSHGDKIALRHLSRETIEVRVLHRGMKCVFQKI